MPFSPNRLTVYCGSRAGAKPIYAEAARALGSAMANRGLGMVYGGGQVGLMGVTADAVLAAGGEVHGVIPRALASKEIAHHGLTELYVVHTMHERKAMMVSLGGGFVALPGGLGTLEELFEVITGAQLGYHAKPIGILDVDGFYGPYRAMLDHCVGEGFVSAPDLDLTVIESDVDRLLDAMTERASSVRSG